MYYLHTKIDGVLVYYDFFTDPQKMAYTAFLLGKGGNVEDIAIETK